MSRKPKGKTPVQYVVVGDADAGRRVDNFLCGRYRDLPRSRVYRMLRRGEVRVNGGRVKQDYRVLSGDRLRVPPMHETRPAPAAGAAGYLLGLVRHSIIHEDADVLVINKPAGVVVHSGSGRTHGVIELLRQLRGGDPELQLVHRLDRETSGCLIIARHMKSLKALQDSFKAGTVRKVYLALLEGSYAGPATVDAPLARNRLRGGERLAAVSGDGRRAVTEFAVVQARRELTLVRATLHTGRTHQIRAHAAHAGHPVAGDRKYGDRAFNSRLRRQGLRRLFLHAEVVEFPRPGGGCRTIKAPLPGELAAFLLESGFRSP